MSTTSSRRHSSSSSAATLIADRLAIMGGSAGGYTTLAALAFRDVFSAGISRYGIGDLEMLARDTHKFESRYMDRLVGPYPQMAESTANGRRSTSSTGSRARSSSCRVSTTGSCRRPRRSRSSRR